MDNTLNIKKPNGQSFSQLSTTWKALVIVGIIALVFFIILVIIVVLIFETDFLSLEDLMGVDDIKDIDTSKYDDIFDQLDKELESELEHELESRLDELEKVSDFQSHEDTIDTIKEKITYVNQLISRVGSITEIKDLDGNVVDWNLINIELN